MKPSISIDLPGWCTLRRDNNSDDEAPDEAVEARSSHSSSVGGPDYVSDRSGKGAGNGSILGDLDSSGDEADGDDAIARLFSLRELKRRTSRSESQLESARNDQADAARKRRRRAANIPLGLGLQAEAYLDWSCVRCTFINAFDQETCQGCGGANLKRARCLRERRKEVERLVRLQSARETRDRSLKEEALKDVLEDSDSENELSLAHASSTAPNTTARQSPISTSVSTFSQNPSKSSHANIATAEAAAAATTATPPASEAPSAQANVGPSTAPQGCFVNILPPDLLLQCAEFLGDVLTLCRVREVSLGWLVALDRREGGRRLWRPVFYRLRASGSIHATTDTKGQQRRTLKVYDLGASTGAANASAATTVAYSREGLPSPSPAAQRSSSAGGEFTRQFSWSSVGAEAGGNPTSEAGSAQGRSPSLRRSSACLVCGLIQRQGYTGSDCEMCASSLMLLPSSASPTTPRVAYTRVNLTEGADLKQLSAGKPKPNTLASASEMHAATVNTRGGGGGSGLHGSTYLGDVEDVEEGGDVDWHFLVKKLAEEKRIASGWGSLHHGWVWLQHALEAMLHRRMDGEPPTASSNAEKSSPDHRMRQGTGEGSAVVERVGTLSGRGGDGGLGDLDPTISRLVRKLANKGWVRLYDSLKATFTLQAEGIARQVVFDADAITANAAAAVRSSGVDEAPRRAAIVVIGLERLRRCIAAWEAYKDWCEEVDMYCELLNEQISAERYRTAGSGCGRGDNTPFIRDTALLSFRHSFALNVQICSILRTAIARGVHTVQPDSNMTSRDSPPQPSSRSENNAAGEISLSGETAVESAGAVGAAASNAEELFTDQELMEDSRAVDFAMRRSFSGQGAGGYSSKGKSGVDLMTGASGVDEYCGRMSGVKVGSKSRVVVGSGSKKSGHYYDWFLSKLERQAAGIVRGDVDARGKRLIRPAAGPCDGAVISGGGRGAGAERDAQEPREGSETLATAGLQELLELARDMIEELDVPDDHLSKDRHTQGAMRRLLLLPIKRWQAVVAEVNEDDPQNLLMAGLSPAPGKEGFHRLRGGAAGRRTGTPPLSALGKDAGKSWEKLYSFFG